MEMSGRLELLLEGKRAETGASPAKEGAIFFSSHKAPEGLGPAVGIVRSSRTPVNIVY